VRAFSPAPGAWCELGGKRVRVLAAAVEAKAEFEARAAPPGILLDDRLAVACGAGALRLLRLQRGGGKTMEAASFLRGRALPRGTMLP
jgi:methionyl-tRNA formyltransferase